jgi:uncharacterized protein
LLPAVIAGPLRLKPAFGQEAVRPMLVGMSKPSAPPGLVDLDALDAVLMSDRAPDNSKGLSDLDGFLTGIVVGPELIMPSEWLPVIWGGEEPEFADTDEATTVLDAIMGRCNEIIAQIDGDPDSFDPVFLEGKDGQVIVTDWASGFINAVKLREKAWEPLIRHKEGWVLMIPLLVLGTDDPEEPLFGLPPIPDGGDEDLFEDADDMIPRVVIGIYDFWRERRKMATH